MSRTWPFFIKRPQPQDGVLAHDNATYCQSPPSHYHLLIGLLPYSGLLRCMPFHVLSQFRRPPFEDLQCVACLRRFLQFSLRRAACSGCFSRTRRKCNFTVVKTPLYCTRKWSYNLSCTSALSLLQLPCNGSTGQVPLEISHKTPGTCTRCSFNNFVWTLSDGQGLGCPWVFVIPTKKNISIPLQLVQKRAWHTFRTIKTHSDMSIQQDFKRIFDTIKTAGEKDFFKVSLVKNVIITKRHYSWLIKFLN